ncbi:threonine synthase [Paucilactobacillus kaifaensis]|uniref:threonine synthase n=1 Tax=Paucilactobacillus kaifaensis TaxID=2559921 RepID=UPI0010F6B3D8|nr:threonine synthase [Paucilactobacillus kaifaensis]
MEYRSTRGNRKQRLTGAAAVLQGLAPDGGLYVPVKFPQPEFKLGEMNGLSYQQVAKTVLKWFFDDFSDDQLDRSVLAAYGEQFDRAEIVSVTNNKAGNYYMELFHGPTLAFKDLALQVLPQLMTNAVEIQQLKQQIVILTATSGDTGTASMRGFRNVTGTQVIVFYPEGGVSPVQLKQMLSQQGDNLQVVAVKGNFDKAQSMVKQIFNDREFNQQLHDRGAQFSSANSMNIGRLIPQIAYYFYTYGQLVNRGEISNGEAINFAVPTGNFGDILAGYYAKKIGLPIKKLICASNQNNVLTDFFKTGVYDRNRPFYLTNSPSMDILVSSNLERLLFMIADEDEQLVISLMEQLQQSGKYEISTAMKNQLDDFVAGSANEDEISQEIKRVFDEDGYAIDPHTAVASSVAHRYQQKSGDKTPTVVVATASPYKFPETVFAAITGKSVKQVGLSAVTQLNELLQDKLPAGIQELFEVESKKETVIEPERMEETIIKSVPNRD